MSSDAKVADRLDKIVAALERAVTAAFLAAVAVGLMCLIGLIIAGTFAILHDGNDFGPAGGGGGDIIVVPGVR